MPRAFLIKKKGRLDAILLGEGEMNNNKELGGLCQENKENMEDRFPEEKEEEEEEKEAGRKEESRQVEEERKKERDEHSRSAFSASDQSAFSSSRFSDDQTSRVSYHIPPPTYMMEQQVPTDLSLKSTSFSAPSGHCVTPASPVTSSPVTSTPVTSHQPSTVAGHAHNNGVEGREESVAVSRSSLSNDRGVREETVPAGHWKPGTKRPSDFSTAFLLSHHSAPKHSRSPCPLPVSPLCPSRLVSTAAVSPTLTQGVDDKGHVDRFPHRSGAHVPDSRGKLEGREVFLSDRMLGSYYTTDLTIPSPSKLLAAPCLSMTSCLEHQPISPMLPSAYQMSRSREDRVSTSSSLDPPSPGHDHERCFPSPVGGLRREDGPSAFRRSSSSKISRDLSWTRKDSEDVKATSPSVVSDRAQDMSPQERRGLSPLARDSVFNSPHELLSPSGLPAARLAVGESRRGSSTSPAHSERTSSGCGSPTDSSEGSPPGQPSRHPGDLSWGQSTSPFLPPSLSANPQLAHMGLRYFPGMPVPPGLTKPLTDIPLPFSYPKSLPEGLDSAFRSPRPPFVHPAAAAYYSSLRTSMAYPFPFSSVGVDVMGKTSPGEEVSQHGADRLDILRALRKSSSDSLSKFQASPPSLQPPHIPAASGAVLSPRPSPRGPSLQEGVAGRTADLKGLSRGLNVPSAASIAVDNRGLKVRAAKDREPVRYQCEACSKSYSTFSGLSKHKQFHCTAQLKKEFSCKHCDKTYVSLGALKMHIRTHTLPCKCTVCGKAFSRPWLLQGHLRTHTGEKPFSCPHCARAFADRSNLRAHLQTHSDVKKYSCRHCSKTFSRMSLLLKHEDSCCNNSI